MTFPAPAHARRSIVCVAAFVILTTIFLAAARLASLDLTPTIRRRPAAKSALGYLSPADAPMSYGETARPGFTDLSVHIANLPERHLPSRANPSRRLVVVGDVHGMRASLDRLLEELHFDTARGDHLVLAGDMINKGPDSRGVLDLAMRLGASAVRGNHEDRVLLAHQNMKTTYVADEDAHGGPVNKKEEDEEEDEEEGESKAENKEGSSTDNQSEESSSDNASPKSEGQDEAEDEAPPEETEPDDLEPAIFPHGDSKERATARSLTRKQLKWLATLPVILDVGTVDSIGNLVVVHAGLVPGLALKRQDPWAVMNMRGLVYPREELRRQEAHRALEEYRRSHTAAPGVTETMIQREHERRRKPHDRKIAIPTDRRGGSSSWPKAWNAHQKALPEKEPRTAVAYGHDSKTGLNIAQYTFGLDSGCVNGGELTALVIEASAEGGVTHFIKSVKCDKDEGRKDKKKKKHRKSKKGKKRSEEQGDEAKS
ncbi:calcineurin-like phosphoesterase [Colletotrichum orchidophilum]|uniref:Calcineurin-like phosphoesterase n=1 Tax=Colletotrichum orchidophilum TaxID=1209926 RepID=A0A1G4BPK1_9PEZI|nr:calcineurin-like phosphoesterase [Colletotrichum orchidophilum]OHF03228.1 calcineurin-like phosphoesterase [Colletotrichum orchidophilum]